MPRDVAKRTLSNDPTAVLHASTKQYAEKVKVSSNDAVAGYLLGKLVAGTNILLTEQNDGGDETVDISAATGLPFSEENNTLFYLGNIGPTRFAFWSGLVQGDPVIIIPDGANDVTQGITFLAICYTSMPSPWGSPYIEMAVFDQAGRPTGPMAPTPYFDPNPAQLVPGGNAAAVMKILDPFTSNLEGEVQMSVGADGAVTLTRTQSTSDYYIGLLLLWI